MRPAVVIKVLSHTLLFSGFALLLPTIVAFLYRETVAHAFLQISLVVMFFAFMSRFIISKYSPTSFTAAGLRRKEGFFVVTASWVLMILVGSLPYYSSGFFDSFVCCIFESASGFTTTGATILTDIEALPHGLLFWRSFTHWMGGMGIIILSVAILPELAVGGMQLFSAEATGVTTEKLAPKIQETAKKLWFVYALLTGIEIILLMLGGMNAFDAIVHAFGTTATGGFSPKNASIGHYNSVFIESVIIVFMLLSAMSFAIHFKIFIRGRFEPFYKSPEIRFFLGVVVVATGTMMISLSYVGFYDSIGQTLRYVLFHVSSIVTTTGFGTADFDKWPLFCKVILLCLMVLGGCAGSTAGGVKVVRLLVVLKHAYHELERLVYPRVVRPLRLGGQIISEDALDGVLGFFILYALTFVVGTTIMSCLGLDFITAVSSVISALNSIGPGLGSVGPIANYAHVPDIGKVVLSLCMVIGRLEIYTVIILLAPSFWQKG